MTPTKTRLKTTRLALAASALALTGTMASADQVINDDLIVIGSACVGVDCTNGLSFGFDTLILKENNLRQLFDDTSTSASFPKNDWRFVANDSSNGGGNYMAIEDATAGRQVFRVEAGARTNALYVEADGDVGIGTNNPAVDLTIVTGNTPTVRLEQDGSSGFTAQTWDLAGNEANFFIRDVTNGSQLPFQIKPGADTASLFIAADNDIGMGTSSPTHPLHVRRTNGTSKIFIEEASSTTASRNLLELVNNGDLSITLEDTSASGAKWRLFNFGASNDFLISTGGAPDEFVLDTAGNLTVSGNITATTAGSNIPDYVFAPDYQLMPLYEVEKFIVENRHLPKIPSAGEVEKNGLNMTQMQIALLEKVEELTLYTLEQQKTIDAMQVRLDAMQTD